MIPFETLNKIRIYLSRLVLLVQRKRFLQFGKKSTFVLPAKIRGSKNILIGNQVFIRENSWIAALAKGSQKQITIGDGTYIGRFFHLACTNKIELGKNVLIADKVYISDNVHDYQDISTPIKNQSIKQLNPVYIDDGSWIGENVCIIGASIGKNCVIGANAVVTKDIPDYSVAVGAPAKVIKKYDPVKKQWVKVK